MMLIKTNYFYKHIANNVEKWFDVSKMMKEEKYYYL